MQTLLNTRRILQCCRHSQIFQTNPTIRLISSSFERQITEPKNFSIVCGKSFPVTLNNGLIQRTFSSSARHSALIKDVSSEKSPDGESIYSGKFTARIVRVKLFSLVTSIFGVYAQPLLWQQSQLVGSTGLGVLVCSIAGIFTFVTPVLLHFIMKKYVVDIRYNKDTDEYTGVTISFFLFKNQVSE